MKQRVTTSVSIVVVVALALLHYVAWTFAVCAVFMIAAKELGAILQKMRLNVSPFFMMLVVPGFVITAAFYPLRTSITIGGVAATILFLVAFVGFGKSHWRGLFLGFLLASIYPSLLASLLVRLRLQDTAFLAFLLLVVSVGDVGALLIGGYLDKRGLAHKIWAPLGKITSPNKTYEGFGASAIFGGMVVPLLFRALTITGMPLSRLLAVGLAFTAVAIVGDLFESFLKRRAGVKDSSNILPGHGGMLDRFDALLFAAVIAILLV